MRQEKETRPEGSETRDVCWCGEDFLETVEVNGVEYLYCEACGGELR